MKKETRKRQYDLIYDLAERHGISRLGLMINESWNRDPKRALFTLARYKFVAKILEGSDSVPEVGCTYAFGAWLFQQSTHRVTEVDFDSVFVKGTEEHKDTEWPIDYSARDLRVSRG